MKKMLSVLLALVMVLTMMAGCQNRSATTGDERAQAQETVKNYLDALMVLDFKKASSFTSDPDKMMEKAPYDNLDGAADAILNAVPQDFQVYKDSIVDFTEAMFETMTKNMNYEIVSIEKDGENYQAVIELTIVDTESVKVDEIMTDMMEDINIEELLMQLLEDGIITENMSEQEMMDILFPAMFEKMTESIRKIDMETTTSNETMTILNSDGTWLVDASSL